MSFFRRTRASSRRPDLAVLLAGVAARQAMTPTARAIFQPGEGPAQSQIAPEIAPFLGLRGSVVIGAGRSASFNAAVAGALLTSGKGS